MNAQSDRKFTLMWDACAAFHQSALAFRAEVQAAHQTLTEIRQVLASGHFSKGRNGENSIYSQPEIGFR